MSVESITSKTDGYTIILGIVKEMYKNGSDTRSEKNGKPISFVEKIIENKDIQVVGLWKYLPSGIQSVIGTKELDVTMPEEDRMMVLRFIRMYANTYKAGDYYCYIHQNTLRKINELLDDGIMKNAKFLLQCRKYFIATERQKYCGSGNNTYHYTKDNYEKSKITLRKMVHDDDLKKKKHTKDMVCQPIDDMRPESASVSVCSA